MNYTIYGDIMKGTFEFEDSQSGFQVLKKAVEEIREAYQLMEIGN